jgi:hypothetical protein
MRTLLAVTAASERVTGLAVAIAPLLVVRLLLGTEPSGVGLAMSRVAGIALLGLGLACWPARDMSAGQRSALRAMSTYNVLATLYLFALGVRADWVGPLLWPAVVAHAVFSAWCLVVLLRPSARVRAATTGPIP